MKKVRILKKLSLIIIFFLLIEAVYLLINYAIQSKEISYKVTCSESTYTLNNQFELQVEVLDSRDEIKPYVICNINGKTTEGNLNEKSKKYNIELTEGLNEIAITIKDNLNTEDFIWKKNIYYIKKYEKQFADNITNNAIQVHFYSENGTEDYHKSLELIKALGVNTVRNPFRWDYIEKSNGEYDFSYYDRWIEEASKNNINIIAGFNSVGNYAGFDYKINNEEEFEHFLTFSKKVIARYPQITTYEILNEPNYVLKKDSYKTEEEIQFYLKIVEELENFIDERYNIISGSTACLDKDEQDYIKSQTFFNKLFNEGLYKYSKNFSYHPYEWGNKDGSNNRIKRLLGEHITLFNGQGGFYLQYITEYGKSSYLGNNTTEEQQSSSLVSQSVILDQNNIELGSIYNFRNTGEREDYSEHNFGLVRYDYTPKKSYYAMKNYYENTNGAEHIGTINLEEGLETHVYDKDGKPKIITWSNNVEKNITIPYENFTAKDIYGNEIKNENGELTITTSPIYLDNIEEKYFYQAISNTATTKYTEFEEKFAEEIEKLPEIKQQTKNLKQQIEQIGKTETRIDEQTAKTLMQRHFQLGNSLINAYQNRRIETEKVKLSSMLDMLNDIGNSYEDLVTVTAKTRNADISQAKELVKEVENIITSNSDIEIVYPAKILEFSKDYQEKAEYINGLEEENDIKTGLIVSKNLHSIYLSNWAKEFTNIYIDEYLKNNLIAENYSEKNITNQDVTVTLNIGDDTKITNNNGSNKYTFTENGEYTFEYERRGRNFRQTVKVENIDKQSPKITGVEEGQVYENKIKPIIEDENLETVRLIQDGRMIDNYINNAEIKEEGMYRIEAIDKAGNKTITSFEIIENISKEYIIENNIIKNIEANTTVEQFKENIKIQTEYNIQREGQTLEAKEKIATGDILQIGDTQYTLIVRGDIDKDSKITIKDLILLRQQIIGEKTLEDTAKTAGDIDLNKKIDARDIVKLRKLILTNNQ